jgi:hypothetical protein
MLDEGSSTNPLPVFVADGRRRQNAVRLLGATLGLLLAGWLAALATGIVGFGALPALPLPGDGSSGPAPVTHVDPAVATPPAGPTGAADPALQRQGQAAGKADSNARPSATSPSGSGASGKAAGMSGSSGGAGATTSHTGSGTGATAPPSGTGTGSTAPPSGTGTGSTSPPSGTGGGSQSNSGSEPAWTPPETGTKGAAPPEGKSSSAPGATVSATAPSQGDKLSG